MASNTEVFFYSFESDLSYDFSKILFDETNNQMTETIHKLMNLDDHFNSIRATMDQTEGTIWHAITKQNNIVYFENNVADFSIIGSMKTTNIDTNGTSTYIDNLEISNGSVFLLADVFSGKFLIKSSTTTQNVLNIFHLSGSDDSSASILLVTDQYFNVFIYENGPIHKQVPISGSYFNSTFDQNSYPTAYAYMISLTFQDTDGSSLNLRDEGLTQYSINVVASPSSYTITSETGSSEMFQVQQNESYFRYVYDNTERSTINLTRNQTHNATIELPCTLDTYDGTKEYYFHFYDTSSPSININNFAFPEIEVQIPMSYLAVTYTVDMMVSYSNTSMILNLDINVIGECNIDN